MSGFVNEWQLIPTSTFAMRFDMPRSVVGPSLKQAEERTFSERCGVLMAAAKAADSECIRPHVALKIMRGAFAAPSMDVRTERAQS